MVLEIATIVLALALAAVLIVVYVVPDDDEFRTTLNDDVRYTKMFDVEDDYTGSFMRGSVFVSHSGSDTKITIVAHVDITQKDEGPAFIFLDKMLVVENILSNYAGSISDSKLFYDHTDDGNVNRVQIGFLNPRPFDNGEGDLVVTIVFNKDVSIPSDVRISMSVGNKTNSDGTHGNCLTSIDLDIPIEVD